MKNLKFSFLLLSALAVVTISSLTSCQCDQSKLFNKTWVLEKYGPESALQGAIPGTPPAKGEILLELDGNGHFSGNDGCNGISGVYKLGGDCQIKFDSMKTTMMMCQEAVMQQAVNINGLFRNVKTYRVTNNKLELRTPDKGVLWYKKK